MSSFLTLGSTLPLLHVIGEVGLAVIATWLFVQSTRRKRSSAPLPPGPPKRPLVGNLMLMGQDKGWEVFEKWSKELASDVISLTGLGQTVIILNSYSSAKSILERNNVSDRPQLLSMSELVGWKQSLIFHPFDDGWKLQRRYIHQGIGTRSALKQYDQLKEVVAAKFAKAIMEREDALDEHCHVFAGDLMLRISYGYDSKGYDPMIKMAEEVTDGASEFGAPGKWMVDVLPFLRYVPDWVPFTGWKRAVREHHSNLQKLVNTPYDWMRGEMDEGRAAPSFASKLLSEKDMTPEAASVIKWSAATLFAGGSHTTVWATYAFLKMMCFHPEIQSRAQNEIDRVVGNDRLPLVSDMDTLPYVWACVLEALRWHIVLPLAVPHMSMEDNVCEGFMIPKGSVVLPNLWAISRDENEYPDAHTFNPERYLGDKPQRSPQDWVFGFGRRVCPGRLMAEESVFIVCATALATLHISRKMIDGVAVPIDLTQSAGLASHPTHFEYNLKPRSEQAKSLVFNAVMAS